MRRWRLFGVAIAILTVLAVMALPAGAGTSQKRSTHRALSSGVLRHSQIGVAGNSAPSVNWTNIAPEPVGVEQVGGGALAGRNVYVPGGLKGDGSLHDRMQTYNTVANAWQVDTEPIIDAPVGWADAAICVNPQTRSIHYVNGIDDQFLYAAHRVYNTAAPPGSRWSFLSYPILANGTTFYSQSSGCAWIGGMMYLFGGYGVVDPPGTAQIERVTWRYDPSTDTWTDTGRLMRVGRLWFGYSQVPTIALAAGGTNDIVNFTSNASTERFSPAGGWVNMAPLPEGRLAPGMGVLGGQISVWGGGTGDAINGFALHNTTLGCTPGCATWTDQVRDLNTHRWFMSWASGGNRLFAMGGNGVAGTLTSSERFP